jgi:triosephosphate isomerase
MTKKKIIIGNWKSNKNISDVKKWLNDFKNIISQKSKNTFNELEIVICPSYIHLEIMSEFIRKNELPLKLGVQNLSPYEQGAYTGEVSASQVVDYVKFVLIGHSERRKYFREDNEILNKKTIQAIKYGLTPVYCISGKNDFVPEGVSVIAYEPVWAIGSGEAELPENAAKILSEIKTEKDQLGIYGGSVNKDNVADYINNKSIDGVLPGGASLEVLSFWDLIINILNAIKKH